MRGLVLDAEWRRASKSDCALEIVLIAPPNLRGQDSLDSKL